MAERPLDHLRRGVQTLLRSALADGGVEEAACDDLAKGLEEACMQAARGERQTYAAIYGGLRQALTKKYGEFLEATLAAQIADGRVAAADAATAEVYEAHTQVDPRRQSRGLFYEILAHDDRFDDAKRRDYATRMERGCYNAAIARCAESADAYQRQWSSPMFVNVYSGRCGLVSANVDPTGSVARGTEGGSWALDRLASGAWLPESLGAMTETELCPHAGKAERDEVMRRLNQKVDEKTSSLFACPRCHKRNHTYRQVQIGSGDEPSTFMCTCKECGQNYEGFA